MDAMREGFGGSADDFRITFANGYTVSVVWDSEGRGSNWDKGMGLRNAVVACFNTGGEPINMSQESWRKGPNGGVQFPEERWNVYYASPQEVAQIINFICNK